MRIHQKKTTFLSLAIISAIFFVFVQISSAQTTAFNFQGRLNDGASPANGKYDLQFRLYDALTGENLIGTPISKLNTTLVNGVFSTQLDFGAAAFDGSNRFIEIRLRSAGTENGYVILGPRQQILSVPYTIRSLRSTLADNATNAVNATNAQTANNATNLGGAPAADYLKYDADRNVAIGGIQNPTSKARLLVESPASSYAILTRGDVRIQGYFEATGDSKLFGNVDVVGNLSQSLTANGLPKATVRLDRSGNITACYNGVIGASTGNCGFTASHPNLRYAVDFGFAVQGRVVSVTTEYDGGYTFGVVDSISGQIINIVALYANGSSGGSATNAPVSIVVY